MPWIPAKASGCESRQQFRYSSGLTSESASAVRA